MEPNELEPIKKEDLNYVTLEAEYVLQNGEKSKLVNSNDQTFKAKLKNEYIDLDISKDFFISKIHFSVENVDPYRFHLTFDDFVSKSEKKILFSKEESEENKLTFLIGRIVRKVRIYYDKGFLDWTKPGLYGVSIEGIPIEIIKPFFQQLINIKKSKEKTDKEISEKEESLNKEKLVLEQQRSELLSKKNEVETKIAESNKVLTELSTQISTYEKEKNNALKLYEAEKLNYTELQNKVTSLQNTYSQLESDLSLKGNEKAALSKEVSEIQTELRGLKKTFATYSNEYASFNKQSNWYILFYTLILSIPVLILGLVFYKLFEGSVDLTTIYKKEQNLEVGTIFITRIPFVIVAGILIQGAYLIFKLIALKIMDIQSEKLALTKISILTQDIVNLSSDGLNLTDEQIYDANVYLRMEMIKAHLKDTIGKDFEYKIRDNSILDSLKSKFNSILQPLKWKNTDEDETK